MNFQLLPFQELTPLQLWMTLWLRQQVFVLEQQCLFPEIDAKDPIALHLLGTVPSVEPPQQLACYCRILAPGIRFPEPCISRVVVAPEHRRSGLGLQLMRHAIAEVQTLWGTVPIQISAQQHLLPFYQQVGFRPVGDRYLEDDIWHQDMLRT